VARQPPPDQFRARRDPRRAAEPAAHDDQPSFLSMVGLVALVVAVVILVFFGVGYLFGRVFL
jgi:hypothetical protein